MNSNPILRNAIRFIVLVLVQILIMKQIVIDLGPFAAEGFVYPLFILLLPVRTTREMQMLLAFSIGIIIDAFYDSYGLHAFASVMIAALRPIWLQRLEPRGGFPPNSSPTRQRLKSGPFYQYVAVFMGIHLIFYYLMMSFSIFLFLSILIKTLLSFIISMIFIFILMSIFDPED
jgi:hypothetical protein